MVLLVAAAFFANLALRTSVATAAASIAVVGVVSMLVAGGRTLQRDAKILLACAVFLAPWLAIRSNAALTTVTFLAIFGLLTLACGLSLHGSLFDSRVRNFARHIGSLIYEWADGLTMVKRLASGAKANARGASLIRGALVAVPVLVVFGLLLASADDVFARFLLIGDLPAVLGHIITTFIVAVTFLALLSRRAHETKADENPTSFRFLGPIEINLILGSLAVLFAAFVGTQVLVALGGADHILETEGLTQADHARRGFFQLVWVAGLSMGLVGILRSVRRSREDLEELAGDDSRAIPKDRFVFLASATLMLTIAIAAVSIQRLLLYIGTFGLTPLRLWALIGAGAIGVAVLVYIISIRGFRAETDWFPGVAVLLIVALVFGLNVVNPDARVASYNLDRASSVDGELLISLSPDATTTIIDNIDNARAVEGWLATRLCDTPQRSTTFGLLEFNFAESSSDRALDQFCTNTRPVSFGNG